ncbi:MAG: M23 family metallopeptidase [Patescibacteria group bacterium]|nr:M23 family metallopeptidase [Patescibacteria group bacterium]
MGSSDTNLPGLRELMASLAKKLNRKTISKRLGNLRVFICRQKKQIDSIFFKYVFEYKTIRRILGTNIAFLIISTSLIQNKDALRKTDRINTNPQTIKSPIVVTTQKGIRYPVNNVRQTQGFSFYHPGIDLDGVTGDPIYPVMNGVVSVIEYSKFAYGNSVIVDHENGYLSRYAHLSKINVKAGDFVTTETKIGEMGATGRSFGDHLHLEIYEDGKPINPVTILPDQ